MFLFIKKIEGIQYVPIYSLTKFGNLIQLVSDSKLMQNNLLSNFLHKKIIQFITFQRVSQLRRR